jgi:hypothetical protein
MTMRKITGEEFAKLFPERVPDRAPDNHCWKCPECGRENATISGLTCHHKADLYEKGSVS